VKDGNTNLRLVNNKITHPTANASCDCQGISVESADLIDGNFVSTPTHNAIVTGNAWDNSFGRNKLVIRNNILVNIRGTGSTNGIKLYGGSSASVQWANTQIYNNSIYNGIGSGISGDSFHVNVTIVNNIFSNLANGISMASGTVASHDFNDFFSVNNPLSYGGSFSCSTITNSEPNSMCSDPQFVSTATPYVDMNFRLKTTSLALNHGMTLSSFSTDYFGCSRGPVWDLGAASDSLCIPAAPGNLRIMP